MRSITAEEAAKDFRRWVDTGEIHANSSAGADLSALRASLVEAFPSQEDFQGEREKFRFDFETGLALYRTLSLDLRTASDVGFWRHLSVHVVPDHVHKRWPGYPADRYWKKQPRIWLRSVWWFVYFAWQGDEAGTRIVAGGMSTDEILNLVERPGRHGNRIELSRALMKALGDRMSKPNAPKWLFRKVMVLNTAMTLLLEPDLFRGGVDGYASDLCDRILLPKE